MESHPRFPLSEFSKLIVGVFLSMIYNQVSSFCQIRIPPEMRFNKTPPTEATQQLTEPMFIHYLLNAETIFEVIGLEMKQTNPAAKMSNRWDFMCRNENRKPQVSFSVLCFTVLDLANTRFLSYLSLIERKWLKQSYWSLPKTSDVPNIAHWSLRHA